jgi:hypothetical protein
VPLLGVGAVVLSFHRRLVRDYEHRLASSASRVYWAMTDGMARRLTGTSTPVMAARVSAADPGPGRHLLDKIDAREQALAREAEQARAQIGELTARLRELEGAISDLQVTRKTLISLAGHDDGQPSAEPAGPSLALPDHPAYQQILVASAALCGPATCAWRWTCRSRQRTPRTSAPSSSGWPAAASLPKPSPDCSSSHAHSPARGPPTRTPIPAQTTKGHQLANRPLRRTCSLVSGRSHRRRSTWPNQARLPLPAVTHRYRRSYCLWPEQFPPCRLRAADCCVGRAAGCPQITQFCRCSPAAE